VHAVLLLGAGDAGRLFTNVRSNSKPLTVTWAQALGYYAGMLCYYWVLATPAVGWLFGCYLYVCVNWFGVHYDEVRVALQSLPQLHAF